MLLLLVALFLGAALFLVAEAATVPARRRREAGRRAADYGAQAAAAEAVPHHRVEVRRLLAPVLGAVAAVVLRLLPKTSRESVAQRLLSAGLAPKISPDELLGAKGILAVLGVLFGVVVGAKLSGAAAFAFALCFGALGLLGPDIWVNGKIAARRELVQAALPDALDLLAVSVEAGLGFDAAVAKLTEYMHGPLVEEFALMLNEMRLGESRIDALKRLAARADVPDLSSFVRSVVQADQLGTSMAGFLRVQAGDARLRRQLAAEEKAMKAPIKMLLPLALFILPALFIVILGPALMNLAKGL